MISSWEAERPERSRADELNDEPSELSDRCDLDESVPLVTIVKILIEYQS